MIDHRARALEVNDATYAAWNAHDPDAVAAVFAEDAVIHDAGSDDVEIGRDAVRDRAARLFAGFPDLTLTRIDLVMDGPRHADRWILTGSHEGELLGLAPTGRKVRVEGATFTVMNDDGMVAEDHHYLDLAGLLTQLGALADRVRAGLLRLGAVLVGAAAWDVAALACTSMTRTATSSRSSPVRTAAAACTPSTPIHSSRHRPTDRPPGVRRRW